MNLINVQTGQPEEIPEAQVPEAFFSQKYNLPQGPLPVRAPKSQGGAIHQIDPNDAARAFKLGYVPVTQAEHQASLDEEKYGDGAGNAAKSALGGFASAVTLGGSDYLGRKFSPEFENEDAKIRAQNPIPALAGNLAGGAALMGVTGGAGEALGLGAEAAEPAASISGKLAQIGTRVAKDATWGGAFGGGQAKSQAALGDKDLTAEHLVSQIGTGALLGGATGLGLWGAGKVLDPVLGKAQEAFGALSDNLENLGKNLDPEAQGAELKAAANTDVRKVVGSLDDALKTHSKLGLEMRGDDGIREAEAKAGLSDDAATPIDPIKKDITARISEQSDRLSQLATDDRYDPKMLDRAQGALTDLGDAVNQSQTPFAIRTAVRGAMEDFGEKASFGRVGLGATPENNVSDELKDVYGSLKDHLTNSDIYGAQGTREAAIRAAESPLVNKSWAAKDSPLVADFKATFGDPRQRGLSVNEGKVQTWLKQRASDNPAADPKTKTMNDMLAALKNYNDTAAESFKNVPEKAGWDEYQNLAGHQNSVMGDLQPAIKGGIGSQQAAAAGPPENGLMGLAAKGVDRIPVVGPMLARPLENPGAALETLSKFADISQRVTSSMQNGIRSFLRGSGPTGGALLSDDILRQSRFTSGTRGENDLEKRTKEIDQYASNPQALNARLQDALGPLHEHAPNVTAAMAGKYSGDLQYLQPLIPRNKSEQFGAGPSGRTYTASHSERRKFAGAIDGVTDPVGALNRAMSSGMVNQAMLDAVRARNPKIYDQFSALLMLGLTKTRNPLSHQQKLTVSRLTGAPLSVSMTPAGVANLQASFSGAGPGGSTGATPKLNSSQINKMDLSKGLTPRGTHLGKGT